MRGSNKGKGGNPGLGALLDKLSRAQRHKARALSGQNSHSLAFLQFAVKQSQQGPRPKQTHLGSRNGTAFCQAESLHTCCDFAGSERWSNYGRMYQQLCAVLQRWSAEGNQTRHASWENRWDWFLCLVLICKRCTGLCRRLGCHGSRIPWPRQHLITIYHGFVVGCGYRLK